MADRLLNPDPLPLNYQGPRRSDPKVTAKCIVALVFAAAAIFIGLVLALGGVLRLEVAAKHEFARDMRDVRREAYRLLICGGLLVVPGIGYGGAAVRELRRRN